MTQSGHIIFGQTDEVVFGKPAAESYYERVTNHGNFKNGGLIISPIPCRICKVISGVSKMKPVQI